MKEELTCRAGVADVLVDESRRLAAYRPRVDVNIVVNVVVIDQVAKIRVAPTADGYVRAAPLADWPRVACLLMRRRTDEPIGFFQPRKRR